jgi:hypothetical protein
MILFCFVLENFGFYAIFIVVKFGQYGKVV